jgi:cytochrome c553
VRSIASRMRANLHVRRRAPAWPARLALLVALVAMSGGVVAQAPPAQTLQLCAACHGADGNSKLPGSPSLAGQPKVFIENQLVMIREGLREVAQMRGLLTNIKDEEFTLLAKYFSEQKIAPDTGAVDAAKRTRGAALSQRGNCGSCHLPDYSGREQMPRLAGQREDFLFASMKEFRDGKATGRDTIMAATLRGLTDAELADMAHYFAKSSGVPK